MTAESSMMRVFIFLVSFMASPVWYPYCVVSEKCDIAIELLFLQADQVDHFFLGSAFCLVIAEVFEKYLARVRVEQYAPRLIAAHVFPDNRNLLRFQKPSYKIDIALWNAVETLANLEHVAATENLGLKAAALAAELHQMTYQQFHGVDAVARARRILRIGALRQHEMVHAADARHWVVQTGGDAGAQHRVQQQRLAAGVQTADVDGNPREIFVEIRREAASVDVPGLCRFHEVIFPRHW